jgi:hypothetical protein
MYWTTGMTCCSQTGPVQKVLASATPPSYWLVEVELLELIDDRPDRLALSGSEPRHQHVDFVLLNEAPCQLLPQCVVTLTVE